MSDRINLPVDAQNILESILLKEVNLYLQEVRFSKLYKEKENYIDRINAKTENDIVLESNNFMKSIVLELNKRNDFIMNSMFYRRNFCCTYNLTNRLRIGVGNVPLETPTIRLHFTYGIPYIPASALKGAFKNCWINEIEDEKKEEEMQKIYKLFGSEKGENNNQGGLVFLDTYATKFIISNDVQTPHYKDYYDSSGKKLPTDTIDPNILIFRCLSHSQFKFHIGFNDQNLYDKYHKEVEEMLNVLCTQYGIGAKTSIGYGIMSKIE